MPFTRREILQFLTASAVFPELARAVDVPAEGPAWERIKAYFEIPQRWREAPEAYRSPLLRADGSTIQSAQAWTKRRRALRREWQQLLGTWPELLRDQQLIVVGAEERGAYREETVRFRWTPQETTTGYLLLPHKRQQPAAAVICVYYEPETAVGRGKPHRDFAKQLAERGLVTLSIGTTEATAARTYSLYHPSLEDAQVAPLSMLGCAAANAWHALANRQEVDAKRIGIVGHSFGGKWAMFASCLFEKFACAAWSDPGIVFDEARPSVNYWEPWYLGYHKPPWRKRGRIAEDNPARGLYPQLRAAGRDLHELHALMAPRPFLVSGGSEDPPRRWQALHSTVAVNRLLGKQHLVGMSNRPTHAPTEESNAIVCDFFIHFLQAQ